MRLSDADALHKEISGLAVMVTGIRCGKGLLLELMTDYRKHILRAIDNAPTIDAVPVVRCAECKYWLCVEDGFGDCTNRRFHLDGCADPSMKMDDFCSCGERRSDD